MHQKKNKFAFWELSSEQHLWNTGDSCNAQACAICKAQSFLNMLRQGQSDNVRLERGICNAATSGAWEGQRVSAPRGLLAIF